MRRNKNKYIRIIVIFLAFLLGIFIISKLATVSSVVFQVATNKNIELKKEDDHVNILILGIGGGSHEGPNLTDTIIFSSINTKTQKVTLISIPRDLWVASLKSKVNEAYNDGEKKKKGGGIIEAKSVVSRITGQPVDYAVVVDFSGFIKAVDLVGGLDIDVDNTLDDYAYPIEGKETDLCGHSEDDVKAFTATDSASLTFDQDQTDYFSCRYEHIHFDQGINHLDGKAALQFVRSRHALGAEGTDFARSKRQEKVIKALKDKVFSLNIILNPGKALSLYNTVKDSIHTDIQTSEFDDFIKLAQKTKSSKIDSGVLDAGDSKRSGLLIHPDITQEYKYEWVLIPQKGVDDFSDISKYIDCEITLGNCGATPTPVKPK